jgi:hypothetical protein
MRLKHGIGWCWVGVERAITKFARVYNYDRAGSGKSKRSPRPRSVKVMAEELRALLLAASVNPPYILVAHSYSVSSAENSPA